MNFFNVFGSGNDGPTDSPKLIGVATPTAPTGSNTDIYSGGGGQGEYAKNDPTGTYAVFPGTGGSTINDAVTGAIAGSNAELANLKGGGLATSLTGLSLIRTVTIVIGILCIFGGILLFKPVSDTVITTAKTAAATAVA